MNGKLTAGVTTIIVFALLGFGIVATPSLQSNRDVAARQAGRYVETARRYLARYRTDLVRIDQALDDLRNDGVNVDQVQGASDVRDRIDANEATLDQALGEIKRALTTQVGDVRMTDDLAASRLNGIILHEQGRMRTQRAAFLRSHSAAYRAGLGRLNEQAHALLLQTTAVADSKLDDQIADLDAQIETQHQAIAQVKSELSTLDDRIAQLNAALAEAQQQAEQARTRFEDLARRGMDFGASDGYEAFKQAYEQAAHQYREALSRTMRLEHGAYPNATLEDGADYLHGRLVEKGSGQDPSAEYGLDHYLARRERAVNAQTLIEATVADLGALRDRLTQERAMRQTQQEQALARLQKTRADAAEVLASLQAIEDEARALEDQAIDKCDESAKAFATAARAAANQSRDAAERVRQASPAAQEFSAFKLQRDAAWHGGHLLTEQASALAGKAWVLQQRYAAQRADEVLLSKLDELQLPGETLQERAQTAEQAKADGIEAVRAATDVLTRAHRDLNNRWTVAAQLAGTGYLLVLFGEQAFLPDVLANYRNALAGREDLPEIQDLKARLQLLEGR